MADISALSLQTALTPVALPTAVAPLENAGNAGEPGTATPPASFDALLTLQAAAQTATPETANPILPESGKTLPDAAIAVAALPLANVQLANVPQAALPKIDTSRATTNAQTADGAEADPLAELADESAASPDGSAEVAPQPDIALFAAIFAAPERLATAARPADTTSAAITQAQPAATPVPVASSAPATTPAAVAVAIASTAQIELVPTARTIATPVAVSVAGPSAEVEVEAAAAVAPETIAIAAPVAAQASRSAPSTQNAAPMASDVPAAIAAHVTTPRKQAAPDAAAPQLPDSATPTSIVAEAPVQTDVQPVSGAARSEAKADRIDFATLVDTLARAREEASPRTVNVAVTNTDFGRVSMRFDSTDTGLAVAMSSADPGFARAISASADAAATSSDTRGQSQSQSQQFQGDARAQASDANAQRHNQNQQGQQHTARGDARPASGTPTSTHRDIDADKTGASGIYA
ncbi:hypothetical protein HGI47_12295 [Novosphingobium sp. ERN07]|uniref:hypothetical protein n=1 Tax=Novosphingobium sp. ERN07 TaxID=2726187 RepID=UPI0014578BFA|nr:hypothetical protein [Novosphingobium sp. ERN07]NLR71653.1 hypothetical protein [Novosphingobium sp. ERN07]